ncbi:MAG TPA: hypothetical protein VNV42_02525 [Solirubrobacteraceae bacterium]|nr:hypothetical protein [Solirubrobacteraceae bacterium]
MSTRRAARTPAVTRGSRGSGGSTASGSIDLGTLQRTAGNDAVTRMLQREEGGPRLPTPSAASAVPARVKGMQATFHERMREANEIMKGTQDHYNYVNGIYAECFKIHQVVVGQAHEEDVHNEEIAEALIAAASLALAFAAPEEEAVSVLAKIVEKAHELDEAREKIEKSGKILKAFEGGEEHTELGEAAMADPNELRIYSLEHVNELLFKVADVHNQGDMVLDKAVDVATSIGSNAPNSGALDADEQAALDAAEAAGNEILAGAEDLLTELRQLRERRKVTVPSWRETEQDIWIAHFSARNAIGTEEVLCKHMVDIGLWGPPGQPGGRLGVAETDGSLISFREPKFIPEHEDEKKQQTVGASMMDWMSIIEAEVAQLPPKWQRIMLLVD